MFERKTVELLKKRLSEPRKFIQVLIGPRQSGKTTIVRQTIKKLKMAVHYASADDPSLKSVSWLEQQWEVARLTAGSGKGLLVIDEIQKIPAWPEKVKLLWDQDSARKSKLRVVLLGSSPLLVQQGLSESLAGRFETIHVTHWSYAEMKQAFDWDLEKYIFFGGYPGSARLIRDTARWTDYIRNSLIETTISRDILLMRRVDKPALLRRLFELGCAHSGQVLSYQKMIGQLQDAGNTTTLAHYLELLSGAGILAGLQKYSGRYLRRRSSSPKFQALNNALLSAQKGGSFKDALKNRELWGRFTESSVGAHLVNSSMGKNIGVFYWSEGDREVDFVLAKNCQTVAIEVKSGKSVFRHPGIERFSSQHKVSKKLLVGEGGIPVEEFLGIDPEELFG